MELKSSLTSKNSTASCGGDPRIFVPQFPIQKNLKSLHQLGKAMWHSEQVNVLDGGLFALNFDTVDHYNWQIIICMSSTHDKVHVRCPRHTNWANAILFRLARRAS